MEISPSILSADFLNLREEIKLLNNYNIDSIHIDVMDGYFVENMTWGVPTVKLIKEISEIPLDVHLLINEPERKLVKYLEIKPRSIYIHPESTIYLRQNLLAIRESGIKVGAALKLETSVEVLSHCTDLLDGILLLACDEGFGGNSFNKLTLDKIKHIKKMFSNEKDIEIIIDGGINKETAKLVKNAGSTKVVSGSYLFNDRENFENRIERLR